MECWESYTGKQKSKTRTLGKSLLSESVIKSVIVLNNDRIQALQEDLGWEVTGVEAENKAQVCQFLESKCLASDQYGARDGRKNPL